MSGLNESSEMLLYKKIIASRYCFVSAFLSVLLIYLIIHGNLPDVPSKVTRDLKYMEETGLYSTVLGKGLITKENIGEKLSIVIREFEDFDNVLVNTVDSIQAALGKVAIFIVADHLPYPPVPLDLQDGVQLVTLSSDLTKNYSSNCPMHFFKTQYVFIIPDAVKIKDWKQLQSIIMFLHSKKNTKAVAVSVGDTELDCQNLNIDLKKWSISIHGRNNSERTLDCSLIKGHHGLLMETETFKSLSQPFARPFPFTFYVQAKLKNWKVRITRSSRLDVLSELYQEPHSNWKHKKAEIDRLRLFYETVGVKQETLTSGITRFYGCRKDTARCFSTVINDMPSYLYLGRWTPPCCLKGLRETAQHVFSVLEKCQVRYWLEGGSLLGAARHHDIIPWDYDVDVGIYQVDIDKCLPLSLAREERYIDEKKFVWEKATEGDFYRVQFSDINHLHVDIYPFYSKNGTMTKDTWFLNHKQDTEFPERFLHPLTKIEFVGTMASAPNSVKEFLEYKFGVGVIEQPKYPNMQKPFT